MKKPLKLLAAIMSILLIPAIFAACSSEEQVVEPVFTLDKTSVDLTVGGNVEVLTLTIANVDETPEWASSNPEVASVTTGTSANKATVRGVGEGAAVITAKAGERVAICAVTVKPGAYITLDQTDISLFAGKTAAITAETNVTTKLTYSSNNTSVATVDEYGLITALSGGVARITVSGGGTSAICIVTVTEPYVSLNEELVVLTMQEGENTFRLEADSNGDVRWSSDNEEVATVNQEGFVTAVSIGETTITARYETASAECVVKVKEEKLNITIQKDGEAVEDALILQPKSSVTLSANITPEQEGDDAKVTWSVKSGEDIVSVDQNGVVTSLGDIYGSAVIVATSVKDPDCSAQCTVTVPDPYVDWVKITDKASLVAALKSGNENINMYLDGDIDLDGATINSTIGNFNGTFDGKGYEIMNFTCPNGLFGGIENGGVVRNLAITCTSGSRGDGHGLFGLFVLGKIENCRFDITVKDDNQSALAHHGGANATVSNVILLVRNPENKTGINADYNNTPVGNNSYCAVLEGNATVKGITQKTEADLKQSSLYEGWDESVWQIEDGEIPVLKNGGNIGELRVVLNTEAETVYKGDFFDLIATVKPVKLPAADRAVIWTSSDESVATVDENGSVTTLKEGVAIITATSVKDNTVSASCTITVELPDEQPEPALEITNASIASEGLKVGNSLTFTIRKNRDDGTLSWTSSDNDVATVQNGKVTAVGEGEVTITATFLTDNGKSASDSVTITVYGDAYIELALSARSVSIGGTYKIDHKALGGNVSWTSSNTSVATVDASGTVSGVSAGKTVITAKIGEKTATMVIQVYEKAAGFIEISTVEQFLGITGANKYYIVNDLDFAGKEYEQNTFNTLVAVIRGNGYSVKNLTINLSGTDVGFINEMGNGFDMQDVNFTNMTIKGDAIHGGFVKLMVGNASVSNCYFQVNMEARGIRIGVIGMMDGSPSLRNCIFDVNYGNGALSGAANANPRAIVGRKHNGTVENCYANQTTLGNAAGKVFAISSGDGNSDLEAGAFKTEAQLKSASTFDESWETSWVIVDGAMPVLKGTLVTEPLKIKLDKNSVELFVGEKDTLTATVTPPELTEEQRAIKWVSEDPTIATVANGVITAVKDGTVIIKAVSLNDDTVVATCTVTVNAIEISINGEDKISELKLGGTKQLKATVNCGEYTWETSDAGVATVVDGLVTAEGAGNVTITVRSTNDPTKYDSITIEVKATVQITVELSDTALSLDRDATATLTATVVNSDSGVTWTSDNKDVATVDENGVVTTHGTDGTATITATAKDDGGSGTYATATCAVTVTYVPVEITLKASSYTLFTEEELNVSDIAEVSKGVLVPSVLTVVSGENVVSVGSGKITATGEGKVTVRLTSSISYNDVTAVYEDIEITVITPKVAISINATKRSLHVGGNGSAWTLEVTLDPLPDSPAAGDVVWTTSNPSAVSVAGGYSDGKYTGKLTTSSAGKATITATRTIDGIDYTVTCEINSFVADGIWNPVTTPEEFKTIATPGTQWYLANDLDFAGVEITSSYLGNLDSVRLDGRGYSLKNIKTNFTEREAGFISMLVGLTVVENVNFVGFDINGNNTFMYGGVIRQIDGSASIRNCYFEGTISARGTGNEAYIGAIGAKFGGGNVENCVFNVGLGEVAPNANANSNPRIMVARWIGGEVKNCIAYKDAVSVPAHAAPGDGFSADKYPEAFKTEEQLKTASTFEGWTAWVVADGEYPRLATDFDD